MAKTRTPERESPAPTPATPPAAARPPECAPACGTRDDDPYPLAVYRALFEHSSDIVTILEPDGSWRIVK